MRTLAALVLSLSLLPLASLAAGSGSTLDQIRSTGKIRIGYRESEPPMSFKDTSGTPVGYTIEICNRIASAVERHTGLAELVVEYVPVDASTRFSALVDNRIDILCGSTTKTLSRAERVDFTQLTFVTGASLLSLASDPIVNVADLRGKKVAVVKDTTTIEVLEKTLRNGGVDAQVVTVPTAEAGAAALGDGSVSAYASDQVVLIGLVLAAADPGRFVVSKDLFSFEPFALAVRRNDADFRLVADRVIASLYRSGEIVRIYRRWFGAVSDKVPTALEALYLLGATPE